MKTNINVIAATNNSHSRRIEIAVSLINGCQRYFQLEFIIDDRLSKKGVSVNPSQVCNLFSNNYSILITEDFLDDNWFSHEYRTTAIISIADWEIKYAPPSLRSYVIYQIAQALIYFSADMSEEMALKIVHEPPVGCIYDMTVHKPDIKLGMVAGNICQNCLGQLRAFGTSEDAIDAVVRIVSLVRAEALGRPITLDPKEVFVVMRFTCNDENDNAWKYGIKTGLESCGLKAVRADERVEIGQILDKIERSIRRSRLVVVKVDENNLNVYFELGFSMGLNKDVLLVSENTLVLNLPSDLKNWECLTYEKGNYDQLRKKIENFLLDNYGLSPIL